MAGWFSTPDNGWVNQPIFLKFSKNGLFEWKKELTFDTNKIEVYTNTIIPDRGSFWVGGLLRTKSNNGIDDNMLLMKINENADTIWTESYGTNSNSEALRGMVKNGNQLFMWGYNNSTFSTYDIQSILLKTDLEGNLPVNIQTIPTLQLQTLLYPNPTQFSAHVILSPKPLQNLQWSLFDLRGKIVRNGTTESGLFDIEVNQLSKGMYFLKFEEGKYPSRKLIVD